MKTHLLLIQPLCQTLGLALLAQFLWVPVWSQAGNLLNVDFGVGTNSAKVGLAATGQTTNDFWNLYTRDDGSGGYRAGGVLTDVKYADGTAGPASLIVSNAGGAWPSGAADPMMGVYLCPLLRSGPISITVSNLTAGLYDLCFYAHGQPAVENGVVHVTTGGADYGTQSTTTDAGWNTPDWQEGRQYVRFQGIQVNGGEPLQIQVEPGSAGLAVMNGLQLLERSDCAPAPAGLVAWWRGEGTLEDSVGARQGVRQNGAGFAAGKVGQGMLFDGVDDYAAIPYSPSLSLTHFSVEAWIKPLSQVNDPAYGQEFIFGQALGSPSLLARVGTNGIKVAFLFAANWSAGDYPSIEAAAELPLNEFSHVAGTWDGATLRIYLNGVLSGESVPGKVPTPATCDFYIGGHVGSCSGAPFNGAFFNGVVDELSLYDRALSAAEIQAVGAAGSAGKCPTSCVRAPAGLVSWWPGEGNANDAAGTNHGTVENGLTFASGTVGRAFSFDGADDYVRISAAASLDVGLGAGMTLEGWICPGNPQAVGPLIEWNDGVSAIGVHLWLSAEYPPGVIRPLYVNLVDTQGGIHVIGTTSNPLSSNRWQHVAVTYDKASGVAVLYLDGAVVLTESLGSFTPQTSYPLWFGKRAAGGGYWLGPYQGLMDEISLYDRALSTAEIQAIFTAGSAGKCPDLCLPSPAGLVGWWQGETNALDTVGSNDGTLLGETSYETSLAGSGFRFDGVNDCVLIPFTAALDLTNFSVEAWVKPLSQVTDPVNQELIFGQGFGKPQLVVRPGTNGLQAVFMFAENLTSFPAAVSTNEIPINQFSHLAGTWDGATLRVYVNGVLGGETATTQMPAASTCPFYIGGFQDACSFTGQFFNGIVDEVSLYNRALLAEEVQAIFDAGTAGKCPPPPPTAPEITVNPASQRVPEGTDVTFRVTATGTPPLTYRWYFSTNAIEAATNDVLVLTNIQVSDEGDYQVVVSNTYGVATSLVARLTVTFPPVITVQPLGQNAVIGSRVIFSVTAVGAEPLSYLWRRNGLSVAGGTGQILILNNVQTTQAGTYAVRVSNADGAVVSASAVLRVGSGQLSLSMTSEGPQLDVVGQAGVTYLIQISSNLVNWSTLASEVNAPTNWSFPDPTATGVDRRFYRLRRSP